MEQTEKQKVVIIGNVGVVFNYIEENDTQIVKTIELVKEKIKSVDDSYADNYFKNNSLVDNLLDKLFINLENKDATKLTLREEYEKLKKKAGK